MQAKQTEQAAASAAKEAAEAGSALPAEKGGACKVAIPTSTPSTGVEKDETPSSRQESAAKSVLPRREDVGAGTNRAGGGAHAWGPRAQQGGAGAGAGGEGGAGG